MKPISKRYKKRSERSYNHTIADAFHRAFADYECKPLIVDWGPDEIAENQRSFERSAKFLEEYLKRDDA